jgi:cytoskeletal protein CcmA (bactofilin family)
VKIPPDGTSAATSRLGTLETSPVGKLDLANNALIVTSMPVNGWTGQTYAGVAGLVASGRNGGTWDGGGIVTSDTRATSISGDLLTIGVVRAGDVNRTFFAGQSVGANDTLVMTTWGGDANLDGKINIDDYGRIDGNIAQSGSVFGWFSGDFNYDGKINIDDYGIIDGNINRQGAAIVIGSSSSLAGVASVPEPVLLAPAFFAAMGLRRRRR